MATRGRPRGTRNSCSRWAGWPGVRMVETNSGVRLDRVIRAGACGTWWSAATAGGHPLGVLQLEVTLIADPAARERLAASVAAVRELNTVGVLRTTELVVEAGRAWLVVAHT